MGIGSDLVSSITGNVESAYLVIKDFRSRGDTLSAMAATRAVNRATAAGATLAAAAAAGQQAGSSAVARLAQRALSRGGASGSGGSSSGVDKRFQVQFNPSELQVYAINEVIHKSSAVVSGQERPQTSDAVLKPRVDLNVPLIFDQMNLYDSFMADKFTSGLGSAQTVSNIASAVSTAKGKVWSVQPQVEGLIAALRNPFTRNVGFYWSTFSFVGQLINVRSQYTMFSTSGRPVRARVLLQIRQELDPDKLLGWYNDFQSLFSGAAASLVRTEQGFANLLNIGL